MATNKELEQQLADAKAAHEITQGELKVANEKLAAFESNTDLAKTLAELEEVNTKLAAANTLKTEQAHKITELQTELQEAEKLNDELQAKVEQTVAAAKTETFGEVTVGNEAYVIVKEGGVRKRKAFTAADIMADPELAALLVKIKSGILKLKNPPVTEEN